MQYPNLFKRVVPFFLALTLGIFLAGAFVRYTPGFGFRPFQRMREIKQEYFRLKAENEDLKQQIEEMKNNPNCGAHFDRHNLLHTEQLPVLNEAPPHSPELDKELKKRIEKMQERGKIK